MQAPQPITRAEKVGQTPKPRRSFHTTTPHLSPPLQRRYGIVDIFDEISAAGNQVCDEDARPALALPLTYMRMHHLTGQTRHTASPPHSRMPVDKASAPCTLVLLAFPQRCRWRLPTTVAGGCLCKARQTRPSAAAERGRGLLFVDRFFTEKSSFAPPWRDRR